MKCIESLGLRKRLCNTVSGLVSPQVKIAWYVDLFSSDESVWYHGRLCCSLPDPVELQLSCGIAVQNYGSIALVFSLCIFFRAVSSWSDRLFLGGLAQGKILAVNLTTIFRIYRSRDYKSSTGIVVGMTTKFPPLASTVDSAVASLRLLAGLITACPPPSMGRIDCIFPLVFYS